MPIVSTLTVNELRASHHCIIEGCPAQRAERLSWPRPMRRHLPTDSNAEYKVSGFMKLTYKRTVTWTEYCGRCETPCYSSYNLTVFSLSRERSIQWSVFSYYVDNCKFICNPWISKMEIKVIEFLETRVFRDDKNDFGNSFSENSFLFKMTTVKMATYSGKGIMENLHAVGIPSK